MTALLNIITPLLVFLFAVLAYRDWNKNKDKIRIVTHYLVPLIAIFYVYQVFQPSYIPKNGVKDLKRMPVVLYEYESEDRLRAPRLNDNQRSERFDEIMDHKKEIDSILNDDN